MSVEAMELVSFIEANGGEISIDGAELVIRPGDAALPVLEALRQYKGEIIALLQSRNANPMLDGEWLLQECIYHDRCWGGIGALYLSLSRWLAERGRPIPASR